MKMDELAFIPTDVGRGSPTTVDYDDYKAIFDRFDKVFTATSSEYLTLKKDFKKYPAEMRDPSWDFTNLFGNSLSQITHATFFDCSDLYAAHLKYPRRGHTIRVWERSTGDPRTVSLTIFKVTDESDAHVLTVKPVVAKT